MPAPPSHGLLQEHPFPDGGGPESGGSWPTILFQVIFPNLRVALLSGALLTFAIVIGELTIALFMAQKTLGPYMANLTRSKVYEPSAMAMVAFAITWAAMGLIAFISADRRKK